MKKAGMGASGVKKAFKYKPGKLSLSTLEADVKIKKVPFKTGQVYSKEQLLSEVKKLESLYFFLLRVDHPKKFYEDNKCLSQL